MRKLRKDKRKNKWRVNRAVKEKRERETEKSKRKRQLEKGVKDMINRQEERKD